MIVQSTQRATIMDFRLSLVWLLVAISAAQACFDVYPRRYCRIMKPYCRIKHIRIVCEKTCRVCRPKTRAPSSAAPATTAPATPAPPTPVVPSGPPPKCGIPAVQQGRVIAGKDAKPGAWPWQIAMVLYGRFTCGGSLITPEWVVTAAHCVERIKDPRGYQIILGAHDITKKDANWQVRKVVRIESHPVYGDLNYDIALMKLEKPAVLNSRVRTVCLPNVNEEVPVGTKCFITGWGKTKHPGGAHPILQQADLPVVSKSVCSALNSKMVPYPISDQMLCAGHGPGNPKSGCHGDSGGPFVCQTGPGNSYQLHGAVSWGSGECNSSQAYTVFARITSLRTWMDRVMKV